MGLMTFCELVAELEKRFPQRPYTVTVELEQERNNAAKCEHEPKVKRSLTWKISAPGDSKYESKNATGRTAEEALAQLSPTPISDLARVNANEVKADDF